MFPLFFINLERRPDRKDAVMQQLTHQGYPKEAVFRYNAKDAKTYEIDQEEYQFFKNSDFINGQPHIVKAIMCNFLSHYDLWNITVNHNLPYLLIAQDDIIFDKDIESSLKTLMSSLPSDAEVIWLALPEIVRREALVNHQYQPKTYSEDVTPTVVRVHPGVNPCSLFYIITQNGARNLIKQAHQVGVHRATDHFINDYLMSKGIHYASKQLLASTSDVFDSDIFY